MAAATASPGAPRLSMGFAASVLFHAGLVAAFVFLGASGHEAPTPPLYRVQLLAAPAGPHEAGVVQPPAVTPPPPKPAPIPKSTPETKLAPKLKPKTVTPPKKATPVAQPKAVTPPKTETPPPPPTAAGGATGGKGADESPLDTPGLEFPYPEYLRNIAREVIHQFQTQATRSTLVADVGFILRRDGTIDPNSLHMVKSSGNYAFDQQALGAVEAAGNTKRFGPLPAGFREDILPVVFRFTPALR